MPVVFPPVESATPEGLLAIGGELDLETLVTAYTQGIFPWPLPNSPHMTWFSPNPRGILPTDKFHYPKSFIKFLKKSDFTVKFNQNFEEVIRSCAETFRPQEVGTWINEEIVEGFTNMFNHELAYSVEVYLNKKLVGGLYGVCLGHYITGESMFHTETGASKLALCALSLTLKEKTIPFIDTQMVTPIIESFGGIKIPRKQFLEDVKQLCNLPLRRSDLFTNLSLQATQLLPN